MRRGTLKIRPVRFIRAEIQIARDDRIANEIEIHTGEKFASSPPLPPSLPCLPALAGEFRVLASLTSLATPAEGRRRRGEKGGSAVKDCRSTDGYFDSKPRSASLIDSVATRSATVFIAESR